MITFDKLWRLSANVVPVRSGSTDLPSATVLTYRHEEHNTFDTALALA